MANKDDLEYLIPAPVLINSEKLFSFGPISFSIAEMIELIGALAISGLLWQLLSFLPMTVQLIVSLLFFLLSFFFITQPINGLPGDTWLRYTARFYLTHHQRHYRVRRGRLFIRLKQFRILTMDNKPLVNLHWQDQQEADTYGFI